MKVNKSKYLLVCFFVDTTTFAIFVGCMLKHQLANNANGTSNNYFTFHHLESIWNDEPGTDLYPLKILDDF